MAVAGASAQIHETVTAWPDVTAHPHRFGGTEYRLGKRELGHVHGNHMADLPFPTRVRDEIVAAGRAEPHHLLHESGWVTLYLREPADVERAIALFRQAWELAARKWAPPEAEAQASP